MNAMIVGADRLGNIPELLASFGIAVVAHISGRDASHQRQVSSVPQEVDLLILLTDFLGHNVMKRFREAAHRSGVSVVCSRRSVCALNQALCKNAGVCGRCTSRP